MLANRVYLFSGEGNLFQPKQSAYKGRRAWSCCKQRSVEACTVCTSVCSRQRGYEA